MYLDNLVAVLKNDIGEATIAELPNSVARKMGSNTQFIRLSTKTVHKQLQKHRDLNPFDYVILLEMFRYGLIVHESIHPERVNVYHENEMGKGFIATVRRTADRQRLYILRFHRARRGTLNSLTKKGPILRGQQRRRATEYL